jgi:hypothetical protein
VKTREEYQDMQKHLLYIAGLMISDLDDLSKIRAVEALWDALENTAKITFYYHGPATESELENFSIANTEIIAHCADARLEEKFIRLDQPSNLPKSEHWAYGHK